jgi:hypothetical protein
VRTERPLTDAKLRRQPNFELIGLYSSVVLRLRNRCDKQNHDSQATLLFDIAAVCTLSRFNSVVEMMPLVDYLA